ncbi:hypothetical protein Maes01_01619 [Microbulbifer aestuariivivens]|uniref:Prepilin-type N-terminal cleavage/methylation domain-containing protein n=1 Tax=Microbulbifer aestuariivivens TaxID=1908308 RepID=A0ABP9WPJ9_9GAMM
MIKKQRGFTLIELMIVVAIIAILAAVALPNYQKYVKSSKRADAQGALMGLAQAMERHYTQRGSYFGAAKDGDDDGAPGIFPSQSPLDGNNKSYDLTMDVSDAGDTYELFATPINGGTQENDGQLRLSSSGERGWDRDNDGEYADNELCWSNSCN